MTPKTTAFDMQLPQPFMIKDREKIRRTVFYGRVSTEHEAQVSALENQIEWYDDQAKRHKNWDVIGKYIDEGITGTQAKKRPSFLRMLEDARAGKFDLIVTREVCRFARNTVDTLVVTRELKNLGIEVYFVDDNIWTMDGDGELRLTIMATLAQEESRKVSERVKAGQHISRNNGTIYGNGNILGYDRVGGTYVINPEQAETVRMVYDLYLNSGMGTKRLANEIARRGRLNASGNLKWTISGISRILNNPTYMGYMAYGKSFSNNYLEQKRINNHNKETYLYKKVDIEPIISEEDFWKVQDLKARRLRELNIKQTRKTIFGEVPVLAPKRETFDKWKRKLRCNCGASFRKDLWRKNKNTEAAFGYQCYNRINNGSAEMHRKIGNPDACYCDMPTIAAWKLEFMCTEILKSIWGDSSAIIMEACDIIRKFYRTETQVSDRSDDIKRKIAKADQKMKNLRDMRAEGDLDTIDFHDRMKKVMDEKTELEAELAAASNLPKEIHEDILDWDKIRETLEEAVDFTKATVDDQIVENFVARITADAPDHYTWYMNLSGSGTEVISAVLSGTKKTHDVVFTLEDGAELRRNADFFCFAT